MKALLLQVAAAPIIFCLLFCVLSAIQFDDQAGFQAGEVGDVWPHCMLSAKFVAMQLAGTQPSPQMLFGIGHLCAQFAGILDCSFVAHASMLALACLWGKIFFQMLTCILPPIPAFPRPRGKELEVSALSSLVG